MDFEGNDGLTARQTVARTGFPQASRQDRHIIENGSIEDCGLDIMHNDGEYERMSSKPEKTKAKTKPMHDRTSPVWAEGLKRMYDSVVDEEIPDEFADLLRKLDEARDNQK